MTKLCEQIFKWNHSSYYSHSGLTAFDVIATFYGGRRETQQRRGRYVGEAFKKAGDVMRHPDVTSVAVYQYPGYVMIWKDGEVIVE